MSRSVAAARLRQRLSARQRMSADNWNRLSTNSRFRFIREARRGRCRSIDTSGRAARSTSVFALALEMPRHVSAVRGCLRIPAVEMPTACAALEAWVANAKLEPGQPVFRPTDQRQRQTQQALLGRNQQNIVAAECALETRLLFASRTHTVADPPEGQSDIESGLAQVLEERHCERAMVTLAVSGDRTRLDGISDERLAVFGIRGLHRPHRGMLRRRLKRIVAADIKDDETPFGGLQSFKDALKRNRFLLDVIPSQNLSVDGIM